jgi:L-2-hydroxyglutarate oxidase LhgO
MVTEKIDCAVIGAGVVGLAIARHMAMSGREVIVLEAADSIGTETSSRNSEVIHAGIYYSKDTLKARLCLAGKSALYAYCAERGLPHNRIGKLIVAANNDEIPILKHYRAQAAANGVTDLQWLEPAAIHAMEPKIRCVAGLLSPSSGIVDSHSLMLSYQGDAQTHGASFVFLSPVVEGRVTADGILLQIGGAEPMTVSCKTVINSAGLYAQSVARSIAGIPPATIPPLYLAKGHYFLLTGKPPFSRLIYPIASDGGLGTHVTLDLAGQVRFGPDVSWLDTVDYRFDESRVTAFYSAIRRYYPDLAEAALRPGYTGIRPKLSAKGAPAADFAIQGPRQHGVPGLVNLYGIESPGLTASLAIAEYVHNLLKL